MKKYSKIKLKHLMESDIAPCDIYLKLNDQKYVQVFKEEGILDPDDIMRYLNQGASGFYAEDEKYQSWSKNRAQNLVENLSSENIHIDRDEEEVLFQAFSQVREQALQLGMEKEVVSMVEKVQEETINSIKNKSISFKILCRLIIRNNYITSLSLLSSTITCGAAIKMSWTTKDTLGKFVLASLFSDITLQSEKLAKLSTSVELDNSFTDEEVEEFYAHPQAARELFSSLGFRSKNADLMMLHHHELPDGSGFPERLTANAIDPYVCLFILGQDVSRTLIEYDFKPQAWVVISDRLNTFYNRGNFRNPIKGLKKLFSGKIN